MDNRYVGLTIIIASGVLMVPVFVKAAAMPINPVVIFVSLLWVIGIALGLTTMEREIHVSKFFTDFNRDLIYAGYMGALIIMIVFLGQVNQVNGLETISRAVSLSLLTIFWGFFLSHVLAPFFKPHIQ